MPAIDGNVLRVISRITGSKKDILLADTKKKITSSIEKILPSQAGEFNEALMELGETICLPNGEALCSHCPIQFCCIAYQKRMVKEIPVRNQKLKRKQEDLTIMIFVSRKGKISIQKREQNGLLAGMYQFPNVKGKLSEEEVRKYSLDQKLIVIKIMDLKTHKHVFTHIDWFMKGYLIEIEKENEEYIWVSPEELKTKYAIPIAFKSFLGEVESIRKKLKRTLTNNTNIMLTTK